MRFQFNQMYLAQNFLIFIRSTGNLLRKMDWNLYFGNALIFCVFKGKVFESLACTEFPQKNPHIFKIPSRKPV